MKKLLIIGAGFLQDFVILKSRELGYYTIAIDGSSDAIGLKHADKSAVVNIVDEKACLEFARQEQVDGVMTAATEYGVLSTSYVAQEMHLPGLDYNVAKLAKNKYEVRRRFIEANVDDTHEAFQITRIFTIQLWSNLVTDREAGLQPGWITAKIWKKHAGLPLNRLWQERRSSSHLSKEENTELSLWSLMAMYMFSV